MTTTEKEKQVKETEVCAVWKNKDQQVSLNHRPKWINPIVEIPKKYKKLPVQLIMFEIVFFQAP